jgi:3-oxoacyl-[acyl-carrier-protein] synthase-3
LKKYSNTMNKITAAITAVGAYVPDFVLSNKVLETIVDTNDEWITSRTGIKERRILKDADKGTSYLAIKAAQDLLAKEMLIRYRFNHNGNSYTRHASCCDWSLCGYRNRGYERLLLTCRQLVPVFYGMSVASACQSGKYKRFTDGADKMSSIVDYTDRSTCIIFWRWCRCSI